MSWAREQVQALIELYKQHPSLYAVKSPLYKNKHSRQAAMNAIHAAMVTLRPGVTIAEIKAKFQGLRSNFFTEYKKYINSQKSGAGADEVYHPTIWYFNELTFLLDHYQMRQGVDSMDIENRPENTIEEVVVSEDSSQGIFQVGEDGFSSPESEAVVEISAPSTSGTPHRKSKGVDLLSRASEAVADVSAPSTSCTPYRKRKGVMTDERQAKQVLQDASTALKDISGAIASQQNIKAPIDSDATLAQFIVSKLKQIVDEDVRIEVEHHIVNKLYEGIRKSKEKSNISS